MVSCNQSQIVDRGRDQRLKEGLLAASVSRLAHAQLDHPGHSVLDHLALPPDLPETRTTLACPGFYQDTFLRANLHLTAPVLGASNLQKEAPP